MGFVQLLFKDREIRLNIRETAFREGASCTVNLLVRFSSGKKFKSIFSELTITRLIFIDQ